MSTQTETLPIGGMTCASCVARNERALGKVPGVVKADVNLATERATVEYIPGEVTRDDLKRAVERAGYEVVDDETPAVAGELVDHGAEARRRAYRRLQLKVAVGFVLSFIIFLGSMQFAFVPGWLQNGWVLWALATPGAVLGRLPVLQGRLGGPASRLHQHEHPGRDGVVGGLLLQRLGVLFPGFFMHQGLGMPSYFDSSALIITLILTVACWRRAPRARPPRRSRSSSVCSRDRAGHP